MDNKEIKKEFGTIREIKEINLMFVECIESLMNDNILMN